MGSSRTPPGSTLEYTNSKAHELQAIAKKIEGVTSVSSFGRLRGPDRGPRLERGDCLINLKPWSERKLTSKQIIAELDEKGA